MNARKATGASVSVAASSFLTFFSGRGSPTLSGSRDTWSTGGGVEGEGNLHEHEEGEKRNGRGRQSLPIDGQKDSEPISNGFDR